MRAALVLCSLLLLGCASMSGPEKLSLSCAIADVASTAVALQDDTLTEGNVLFSRLGDDCAVAANAGIYVGLHFLLRRASRDDEGTARSFWYLSSAFHCAAAGWNISQVLDD